MDLNGSHGSVSEPNQNALNVITHTDDNNTAIAMRSIEADIRLRELENEDRENSRNHRDKRKNNQFDNNLIPNTVPETPRDTTISNYIQHVCHYFDIDTQNININDVGFTHEFVEHIAKPNYVNSILFYGVEACHAQDKSYLLIDYHNRKRKSTLIKMGNGWSYEVVRSLRPRDIVLVRFMLNDSIRNTGSLKITEDNCPRCRGCPCWPFC